MKHLPLLLLLFATNLFAQVKVQGVVKCDGEALAFTQVICLQNGEGTMANQNGEFAITVNVLTDSLQFMITGYETRTLSAFAVQQLKVVALQPTAEELDAVTVTGKSDFAKTVIKNVIKNSAGNNYNRTNLQGNLYVLSTLQQTADSAKILGFYEKYSAVSKISNSWQETVIALNNNQLAEKRRGIFNNQWRGPRKAPVRGDRENNRLMFFNNLNDGLFNFYDASILIPKLGQNPFISPTGGLALLFYNYEYLGAELQKGLLIHKIKVIPKIKETATFVGIVEVLDVNWAIVSVNFELSKQSLHYYNSFIVKQLFHTQSDVYFPFKQTFKYSYKKPGGNPQITGHTYAHFTNFRTEVNTAELLPKNRVLQVNNDALDNDTAFWANKRNFPLTAAQQEYVTLSDSLKKVQQTDRYISISDSLKNRISAADLLISGIDHYNTLKGEKWQIFPLIKQAQFFGLGGYRHALGGDYVKSFKATEKELYLNGVINYGFNNRDLLGNGKIKYVYAPKKFAQFRLNGGKKYELLTFMQNLAAVLSPSNFVQNTFLSAGHYFEVANGIYFDANIKYMNRQSLSKLNLPNWNEGVFGDENTTPLDFESYNELNIVLELAYTPNQKYALYPKKKAVLGSKWPTFKLRWEQGLPDVFGAKINYQLLKLGANQSFKVGVLGTSKYLFWAGKFLHTNSVELPNFMFFRGTDPYFFSHPLFTFQLLGDTYSSLSEYASLNYIHHFHGALIKKVPYLRKTKLEAVAGCGGLWINDNNLNHIELFAGLEIPFSLWGTKLKFGAYQAAAYSNLSNASNMIKFGINIFDPFTNKWAF